MITLYGFGEGFGLPEISPFVTKTELQLKMAGLGYRKERAKPPASPKGQLPYIVDDAESGGAGQIFIEDAVVDRCIHDEHQQKESKICGNDQNGTLKQI